MSWLLPWLQKGIDREFYLLFSIFDENDSWYLNKNIEAFTGDPSKVDENDEDFKESNKMHGTKYLISVNDIFSSLIIGRFYRHSQLTAMPWRVRWKLSVSVWPAPHVLWMCVESFVTLTMTASTYQLHLEKKNRV